MKAFLLIALLAALACAKPSTWAVVIAGSNTYSNYRHQSDVAHQYHVYLEMGVPADHIITFSYDDVPLHKNNPFPGEVFALPGDDPRDFYKGLVLDYKGTEVNKKNFYAVLRGDKATATGRVVESTEEDNIFVSYYDHGTVDAVACIKDYLYKKEIWELIRELHDNKKYNKMVFYIEACDSFTMAHGFPTDLNAYLATSTDAAVSGWACFCPPQDVVRGKHIGACLSEEFGTYYMMNQDETKGDVSWKDQFTYIHKKMEKSKPAQHADLTWNNNLVKDFFHNLYSGEAKKVDVPKPTSFWDTRDNNMLFWANQLTLDLSPEDRAEAILEYKKELAIRAQADQFFEDVVSKNVGREWRADMFMDVSGVTNDKCYYDALERIHNFIPRSDYVLKYFKVLANICDKTNADTIIF